LRPPPHSLTAEEAAGMAEASVAAVVRPAQWEPVI
jgi:hypothetical protein